MSHHPWRKSGTTGGKCTFVSRNQYGSTAIGTGINSDPEYAATKRLAVKLSNTSNDVRLLSPAPRAGFGEINPPPMQPGSSIVQVNPVIPEVVNRIAFKVIGKDLTVVRVSLKVNP